MKFTKNEKKVLTFLIENARVSDRTIAEKLKISSQAVGKIRKKLEVNLKISYSLNLDYSKLGIEIFSISLAKMTDEGLHMGELEIEKKLIEEPHVLTLYRVPNQNITHIMLYGFCNIRDLDNFFHSEKNKNEIFSFIENQQLFTFSIHSQIKRNPLQLFKKIIERSDDEMVPEFKEIDSFKKKLKIK